MLSYQYLQEKMNIASSKKNPSAMLNTTLGGNGFPYAHFQHYAKIL